MSGIAIIGAVSDSCCGFAAIKLSGVQLLGTEYFVLSSSYFIPGDNMKAYNVGRWIGGSARSTVHVAAKGPAIIITGGIYTAQGARELARGVHEGWVRRGDELHSEQPEAQKAPIEGVILVRA